MHEVKQHTSKMITYDARYICRAFNMIKSIGKKLESFFFSLNFDWQAMMQSASYLTAPLPSLIG